MKAVQKLMTLIPAAVLVMAPAAQSDPSYSRASVVSATPIYASVERIVPREVCYDERVQRRHGRVGHSVTGPILGAIIGGAIGNAVGHNRSNKRVGTVVGAVLGGSIGADIARRQRGAGHDAGYRHAGGRTEQVCRVVEEHVDERVLTGYDVTYRYAGETYFTRMDRDPGRHLKVRVSVTPV